MLHTCPLCLHLWAAGDVLVFLLRTALVPDDDVYTLLLHYMLLSLLFLFNLWRFWILLATELLLGENLLLPADMLLWVVCTCLKHKASKGRVLY